MNLHLLAAAHDPTAPGWGKFLAMVIAIGGVWMAFAAKDRLKRVRDGEEIDPFSSEAVDDDETEFSQVDTPAEEAKKGSEKGVGKWLRRG